MSREVGIGERSVPLKSEFFTVSKPFPEHTGAEKEKINPGMSGFPLKSEFPISTEPFTCRGTIWGFLLQVPLPQGSSRSTGQPWWLAAPEPLRAIGNSLFPIKIKKKNQIQIKKKKSAILKFHFWHDKQALGKRGAGGFGRQILESESGFGGSCIQWAADIQGKVWGGDLSRVVKIWQKVHKVFYMQTLR